MAIDDLTPVGELLRRLHRRFVSLLLTPPNLAETYTTLGSGWLKTNMRRGERSPSMVARMVVSVPFSKPSIETHKSTPR
jgi:hypothetical protein